MLEEQVIASSSIECNGMRSGNYYFSDTRVHAVYPAVVQSFNTGKTRVICPKIEAGMCVVDSVVVANKEKVLCSYQKNAIKE